jgi:hypothetical protein
LPETYQINRTKIKPQSGIDTDLRNNYQWSIRKRIYWENSRLYTN